MGEPVAGTGIPPGTTIASINTLLNLIVLSQNATVTGPESLTFATTLSSQTVTVSAGSASLRCRRPVHDRHRRQPDADRHRPQQPGRDRVRVGPVRPGTFVTLPGGTASYDASTGCHDLPGHADLGPAPGPGDRRGDLQRRARRGGLRRRQLGDLGRRPPWRPSGAAHRDLHRQQCAALAAAATRLVQQPVRPVRGPDRGRVHLQLRLL